MTVSRAFQVFAKPVGAVCNMNCRYCYYLEKEQLYPDRGSYIMPDDVLQEYILQHIQASTEKVINFSWHGGEPMVAGLDFFRRVAELQRKHKPADRIIINGMQTNGTLLDDAWCKFLSDEKFLVGISIDGPAEFHDINRIDRNGGPSFERVLRGYELLKKYKVVTEILCVVHAENVHHPLKIYRFFKQLKAQYITFLPLVEKIPGSDGKVTESTVPAAAFGDFMSVVFDEWVRQDIGKIKVQLFEEAARTAFKQEHTLCIFKETCGGVPVVERNGDFYSCDHYVDADHHLGNIAETPLVELIESDSQREFGKTKRDALPEYCLKCEVKDMCNGECPKNRFINTPDGEFGLNYLCAGYKQFFSHCRPFVDAVASEWKYQNLQKKISAGIREASKKKIGRNDPCPCGSGKKYKNCCM
ncbi:MAG: anaerobic sulfatase maturase [Bacteroidales bacterium]|nr:anaerobic sulfatase maturase [Bacteroidales bacterium]